MELDELKKSWNALDEHLKDKEFIKDEEITGLIAHAQHNLHHISRFTKKLRYTSFVALVLIGLVFVYSNRLPETYFQILFLLCIPALSWDLYTTHYLESTNVEEMPLVTVIGRINRYHKWVIRERIGGIVFITLVATLFFLQKHIWTTTLGTILYFTIWGSCLCLVLWIYRSHLGRIKEIKKNLNELKELNHKA